MSQGSQPIGHWQADHLDGTDWSVGSVEIVQALADWHHHRVLVERDGRAVALPAAAWRPGRSIAAGEPAVWAQLSPLPPERLGDAAFRQAYGLRFAVMAGAMAGGIASAELVVAMARAGGLGSYGAGGQGLASIATALDRIQAALGPDEAYAVNLIHSPGEPGHEMAVAELLLDRGVAIVEASAYLQLTPAVVRYRVSGLRAGPDGAPQAANRVIAKASRTEVASRWLQPPPAEILERLLAGGQITAAEGRLAKHLPMADDLTAESDSGGHTDNRPALCMLPTFLALRDRLQADLPQRTRIGLAGGIATPEAVAAAYSLGAAYVVTGSINQACVESGSCDRVRQLLAEAEQADVIMAPAADMFEMGVKLQVLKRGTMFAMRAQKLYELYRNHAAWQEVPAKEREQVQRQILRAPFERIWAECETFWAKREPRQLDRARAEPKHQMALVFRWYLGMASRWANTGVDDRSIDYQVWCGPAMGAFNEWTRGSHLADPATRRVGSVTRNLLAGAAWHLRQQQLRLQGVLAVGPAYRPLADDALARLLD